MNKIEFDIVFDEDNNPQSNILGKGMLGTENGFFIYDMATKMLDNLYGNIVNDSQSSKHLSPEDIEELRITLKTLYNLRRLTGKIIKNQNEAIDELKDILKKDEDD